jgi:uncharacterized protein YndB with AHSA1/START domain
MSALAQANTADREIVISRVFDAPRELVFDAWTDPRHIGEWWGPNGFTTTTYEMDVRVGGMRRFTMHGPDGVDWPNWTRYSEVVRPEKLAYEHGGEIDQPAHFDVTITFENEGGKTLVTMRSLFPSVEAVEKVKAFGAVEGGKQTLARLADYLEKSASVA